jgi:hypothetical protein
MGGFSKISKRDSWKDRVRCVYLHDGVLKC